MDAILEALKSCIIAVLAGCISLKLITGSVFDITPVKINLTDFFNKKSKLEKSLNSLSQTMTNLDESINQLNSKSNMLNTNMDILLDNIAEVDGKINSFADIMHDTSAEIAEVTHQIEVMKEQINKNTSDIQRSGIKVACRKRG